MTKVYVIRHGETEGNIYAQISGFYDTRLTSRGKMQAEALAERFKDIHIDAVYSSNRVRAIQTAQTAIKGKGLELNITQRVGECNLGSWDGDCWGHICHENYDEFKKYRTAFHTWRLRYSEPVDDLRARMIGAVRELAAKHDGQTIMIVSHGHAIRALHCEVLGVPREEISKQSLGGNTAVSLLNVENGIVTAEYIADCSHLNGKLDKNGIPLLDPSQAQGSGINSVNIYCEPIDLEKDADYYLACRKEFLEIECGSFLGFDEEKALADAKVKIVGNMENILICKDGDKPIGIVELNTRRDAEHGYGWIEFYYIEKEYKLPGTILQPFGHIIQFYRAINRVELRWTITYPTADEILFLLYRDLYIVSRDEDSITFGYDLYM